MSSLNHLGAVNEVDLRLRVYASCMKTTEVSFSQVLKSGTLLGMALGSLFDGILPYATLPEWQEAWYICSWLIALYGLVVLWMTLANPYTPRSGRAFFGSFLVGWGLYLVFIHALFYFLKQTPFGTKAELLYVILGFGMTAVGVITVRRARRSFFHHVLETIQERDVLGRPQGPPPFNS